MTQKKITADVRPLVLGKTGLTIRDETGKQLGFLRWISSDPGNPQDARLATIALMEAIAVAINGNMSTTVAANARPTQEGPGPHSIRTMEGSDLGASIPGGYGDRPPGL